MITNFASGAIIKITCLLLAGLALDGLMRRKWVLATAAMWNGVLVAIVLLPPAMLLVPQWVLPALPLGSREVYPASDIARLTSAGTLDEAAEPSIDDRGNGAEVANNIPAPKIHDNRPTSSDNVPRTLSTQLVSVRFLAGANTAFGWLAPLYFLGVATAFVRLLNSWRTINLMRQQASPVTHRAWRERFDFWQTRLGLTATRPDRQATSSALRSTIRLLDNDEIDVPVALGVHNRTILIPSRILANAPTTDIDAILLHEMAHFARFDCEWQWVQRIVEAILWFHPLSWIARGRISFIRERSCDDFAFHAIGDREAYTKTLLDVATGLARRRALGLGLTILRPGNLARRLEALQQSHGCSRCRASRGVRRAVVVVSICCTAILASVSVGRVQARDPVVVAAVVSDAGAANTEESNRAAEPTTEKPQPAPEIDEIRQLNASLDRIKVIAWTARERTDITRTPLNARCGSEKWMQVSRDGDKWAVLTKETGDILSDGKPMEYSRFQEYVFDGKRAIQINENRDIRNEAERLKRFADPKLVPLPTESKSMQVFGSLDGPSTHDGISAFAFLGSGRLLFGHMFAFDFLPELISGGKLDPDKNQNGQIAVTSKGPRGTCTVWLDPQHGFLPARIESRKSGDDRFGDSSINKTQRVVNDRRVWPDSQLVGFRQVIDNVSFARFNDMPVLQQFTDTSAYIYEDGQQLEFRHQCVIDEFHLPQANSFSPTIKIPDHTVVLLYGSRNSGYQWYQGQMVRDDNVAVSVKIPPTMRIQVLGSTGDPAPGAKIHASVWTKEDFPHNQDYLCDGEGIAIVKLPKTLSILRLWAHFPKHVGLFANWSPESDSNTRLMDIPSEFTFRLEGGTIISGFVQDDQGQPIPGVQVAAKLVDPARREPEKRPRNDTWLAISPVAKVTDEQGLWLLDNVPAGDDVEVQLLLTHPDYSSDYSWGGLQKEQHVTTKSFRDGNGTIVMHRGRSIAGTVTDDETGKPVASAVVVWGTNPYFQQGSQEVRTNPNGAYQFPPLPPGPMKVTVVAPGFAPELKQIDIGPQTSPLNFQLKRGKTLRLRFLDKSGAPIPEVQVGIEKWRGGKSLYNNRHPNVIDTGVPYQSNSDGVFEWTWAPDDEVSYNFFKEGYRYVREKAFLAGDGEHVIALGSSQ